MSASNAYDPDAHLFEDDDDLFEEDDVVNLNQHSFDGNPCPKCNDGTVHVFFGDETILPEMGEEISHLLDSFPPSIRKRIAIASDKASPRKRTNPSMDDAIKDADAFIKTFTEFNSGHTAIRAIYNTLNELSDGLLKKRDELYTIEHRLIAVHTVKLLFIAYEEHAKDCKSHSHTDSDLIMERIATCDQVIEELFITYREFGIKYEIDIDLRLYEGIDHLDEDQNISLADRSFDDYIFNHAIPMEVIERLLKIM